MALVVFLLFSLFAFSNAVQNYSNKVGINYGRQGDNLQSPYQSIELLKGMNVERVKLYDANPETLKLLARTNIQVSVMVPNDQISAIASNQSLANHWVRDNVLAFYPDTKIRFILVGNEVLSYNSESDRLVWRDLVPAMQKIKKTLVTKNIRNIKVGTPLAMDMMETTFPPSSGTFRPNIIQDVMLPLLHFLNGTNSFFFVDVYPYLAWSTNTNNMSLDYALFRGNNTYTDPANGLNYTNLLDQMLDSVVFAMTKLGYNNINLAISETGWPHSGDVQEAGANIHNAATYNRNLVRKMTGDTPVGTPARPNEIIPTFIFSLYDENQKDGPGTERHWGLFNANGSPIYEIDINGNRSDESYMPLPPPKNNEKYKGQVWCIVRDGVREDELGAALGFACGQGNDVCSALAPGKECYEPIGVVSHANYAFSSYWAKFWNTTGGSCYFNGLAIQSVTDPSHGSCNFPSVTF